MKGRGVMRQLLYPKIRIVLIILPVAAAVAIVAYLVMHRPGPAKRTEAEGVPWIWPENHWSDSARHWNARPSPRINWTGRREIFSSSSKKSGSWKTPSRLSLQSENP